MDTGASVHMRIDQKNRKSIGSGIKALGFTFNLHWLEAVWTSGKSFKLSETQFAHLENGDDINPYFTELSERNELMPLS